MFVFSFGSQNTQSTVKVRILIAQKNIYFNVLYVMIVLHISRCLMKDSRCVHKIAISDY